MSEYQRLIDARVLTANFTPERDEAFDAGAYTTCSVDCRILKSGSGGNVFLEHAAVNEPDAYRPLSGATWLLTGTGGYFHVPNFLRYVRVRSDGATGGGPVVTIDAIAKA